MSSKFPPRSPICVGSSWNIVEMRHTSEESNLRNRTKKLLFVSNLLFFLLLRKQVLLFARWKSSSSCMVATENDVNATGVGLQVLLFGLISSFPNKDPATWQGYIQGSEVLFAFSTMMQHVLKDLQS